MDINLILAISLVAACTWTDLKHRMIYNHFTYPAVLAGLVSSIATGQYANIWGSLIIFAVYLFFFTTGKMGGGDLKLAVALSLFLGMEAVLLGSIMAGVVMMIWGFAFTWARTGQIQAAVLVMAGKLPGGEAPYGALLGPTSLLIAVLA
ncbi:MAG: prepilin peptidase [Bacillota bacterium]